LLAHNTFGIDASCRRFLEYSSIEEARLVTEILRGGNNPFLIIGGGSNLLLTKDYAGVVVHSAIKGIEAEEQADGTVMLTCGSGEVWDDVVAYSVERGWYGAENLSIIPGEVGASAVQNIGAYGAEVCQIIDKIEAVEIATGKICTLTNADCQYGYRDSRFKHDWKNRYLMLRVCYQLSAEFRPKLDYGNIRAELERKGIAEPTAWQLRQTIIDIRRVKLPDPEVTGNAGSFFMNPVVSREKYESLAAQYDGMPHYTIDAEHEKIPAGWMIDQCGWKGRALGRAGVHSRQALVLVNLGGATGSEIVTLCEQIRHDVRERFGIDIYPEVNIV
jgi:UDP-N-acetylmuramate dehydrogenase